MTVDRAPDRLRDAILTTIGDDWECYRFDVGRSAFEFTLRSTTTPERLDELRRQLPHLGGSLVEDAGIAVVRFELSVRRSSGRWMPWR